MIWPFCWIRQVSGSSWSPRSEGADLLFSAVFRERERQRRAAIPLAQRIYVENARQFVDRIEGYWLAYRPHSQFLPK